MLGLPVVSCSPFHPFSRHDTHEHRRGPDLPFRSRDGDDPQGAGACSAASGGVEATSRIDIDGRPRHPTSRSSFGGRSPPSRGTSSISWARRPQATPRPGSSRQRASSKRSTPTSRQLVQRFSPRATIRCAGCGRSASARRRYSRCPRLHWFNRSS